MATHRYPPGTGVRIWCGFFWHAGLIDTHGRVIHNSKARGRVVSEPLADFAEGQQVHPYPGLNPALRAGALQRARQALHTPYHLWDANCEQFLRWAYGLEPTSPQLQKAIAIASGTAVAVQAKHPGVKLAGALFALGAALEDSHQSPWPLAALLGGVGLLMGAMA